MSMFTAQFAVARTVGWISQWSEMIEDPQQKTGRPRQLYIGVGRREYMPIWTRTQVGGVKCMRKHLVSDPRRF
jgi:citrate synthase